MPQVQMIPPRVDPFAFANREALQDLIETIGKLKVQERQRQYQAAIMPILASAEMTPEDRATRLAQATTEFQQRLAPDTGMGIPGVLRRLISGISPAQPEQFRASPMEEAVVGRLVSGAMPTPVEQATIGYRQAQAAGAMMPTETRMRGQRMAGLEQRRQEGTITDTELDELGQLYRGRAAVELNIGKTAPKAYYDELQQAINTKKTVDELLAMTKPGGPSETMLGPWNRAYQRLIKEPLGLLTPEEQQFKQKYIQLQNVIRQLNVEGRLSDQDYERLKGAIPSLILGDEAFRKGLEQLRDDNEIKIRTNRQMIEELGYIVPGTLSGVPQQRTMTATNPTTGQRIISTDGGQTWQPMQ